MPETEEMLTTEQARDRLGVSVRTVKSWIASGELPSVKMGGARRIEARAVEAFIAARREGGGDGA